jgi:hypothetical protein
MEQALAQTQIAPQRPSPWLRAAHAVVPGLVAASLLAIDRRFYRRKYDAARTVAGFGAAARDETDLERLSARLVGVVDETMQPEAVGLWLRPAARTDQGNRPA